LNPPLIGNPGDESKYVAHSLWGGEANIGTLKSPLFTIEQPFQTFWVSGWDGTLTGMNNGDRNWVLLRDAATDEVLRRAHTPGCNELTKTRWLTLDLIGRQVYVELVDNNPVIRPGGFAWLAFADYQQGAPATLANPVTRDDLWAVQLDQNASLTLCRTMPFFACPPEARGPTRRSLEGLSEVVPVGAEVKTLYVLGLINEGWDYGVAHWGEHPEIKAARDDQVNIGSRIGSLELRYADGTSDTVPLVIGATAWFVNQWAWGPTHGVPSPVQEPFLSRPDCKAQLERSLLLRQSEEPLSFQGREAYFYLGIQPRSKPLAAVVMHDNEALRGRPLVTALTVAAEEAAAGLHPLGAIQLDKDDLQAPVKSWEGRDFHEEADALARALYTSEQDLPERFEVIDFPQDFKAAKVRFLGGVYGDMLSNLWVANLLQIDGKFAAEDGVFHETAEDSPWYGGYSGIGAWAPVGIYYSVAFGRCSDALATLGLRLLDDQQRVDSFVDFVDGWLYFFRPDHDPEKGPPNQALDVARYPADMPPHWSFGINGPISLDLNEVAGTEELDGHGATCVGRWVAWRMKGAPTDDWLTEPREEVFGKSRWDSTKDAAEFICWWLDYTGVDVPWCEGETTGWGGADGALLEQVKRAKTPEEIRHYYANSDLYEPYPAYVCLTGLKCSADIAEALGESELAKRWRDYAQRIAVGMIRALAEGPAGAREWRVSPNSVYPSFQDSLVQAWFAFYRDGLDPLAWDPTMTAYTRNTLKRQLAQPYGHAPALAMGYGMGWITKAALLLDELDDAGPLLTNIAKYTWDKNMDYVDEARGVDWRLYQWVIPEGTNILPDGAWYRIGDLSNGANQGAALHALEQCAGVDDTNPADLKLLPRAPEPLTGLEVSDFPMLIPEGEGLAQAKLTYTYSPAGGLSLTSDKPLPALSVRLGPFASRDAAQTASDTWRIPRGAETSLVTSGHFHGQPAWWLWVKGLRYVKRVELGPR
jgi:hypothetical protein